jgi:hypothetical protein
LYDFPNQLTRLEKLRKKNPVAFFDTHLSGLRNILRLLSMKKIGLSENLLNGCNLRLTAQVWMIFEHEEWHIFINFGEINLF